MCKSDAKVSSLFVSAAFASVVLVCNTIILSAILCCSAYYVEEALRKKNE